MTRTELLALAERNDAHAELHEQELPHDEEQRQWAADMRANAALLRKLAALQPVAQFVTTEGITLPLYTLSEVLTDE